jgi:uncharacterized protein (DUF1800 family)
VGLLKVIAMLDGAMALHLSNRLGFGPAPGQLDQIKSAGFEDYVETQLHPQPQKLPPALDRQLRSIPTFGKNTFDLYREHWWKLDARTPSGQKLAKEQLKLMKVVTAEVAPQIRMARLARSIASPYQLHEALVDFWFNHFNVYARKKEVKIWIGAYEEEAIRPHTLGRFSDLLLATAKHPAMLVYLDNWRNVAPGSGRQQGKMSGINENYAREVMELHTLGVDGGYTQSDVTSLAHILTGWTVGFERGSDAGDPSEENWRHVIRGGFHFAPQRHDASPQTLLGRKFAGADVGEGEAALLMLAHHPSTARHVSFKLAQYFVLDQPPQQLVDAMAETFRKTDGDIRAVVRTMLESRTFRDPSTFGRKFKTPYRYVVSAARAVGEDPAKAAPLAETLKQLGQPLYECVTPDGYACTESAWLDPDAMMRRISFAVKFGSGAFAQAYLTNAGYGTMSKKVHLQPEEAGGTPVDPDKLLDTLGLEISSTTRAALAKMAKPERAGAILGSPEFMRS